LFLTDSKYDLILSKRELFVNEGMPIMES
jgi:hypothetical protein